MPARNAFSYFAMQPERCAKIAKYGWLAIFRWANLL
jgi:hypothetical protein